MSKKRLSDGHGAPHRRQPKELNRIRLIDGNGRVVRTFRRMLVTFFGIHQFIARASHRERLEGWMVPWS